MSAVSSPSTVCCPGPQPRDWCHLWKWWVPHLRSEVSMVIANLVKFHCYPSQEFLLRVKSDPIGLRSVLLDLGVCWAEWVVFSPAIAM